MWFVAHSSQLSSSISRGVVPLPLLASTVFAARVLVLMLKERQF